MSELEIFIGAHCQNLVIYKTNYVDLNCMF